MSNAPTASTSPIPPAFVLEPPFTKTPIADTILRSSDEVDFYVHRAILSLVAPVFETMPFTLRQSQGTPAIPVIDLAEHSAVLDQVLRFFYPTTQPTYATLDELRDIIEILVSKYDMQCLVPAVKKHLESYLDTQPLAVFAVAFRYRWEDVGKAAAKESLKHPLRALDTEAPLELNGITAVAYHNLLHYHSKCGHAAQKTTNLEWLAPPPSTDNVAFGCAACQSGAMPRRFSDKVSRNTVSWVLDYLQGMADVLARTPGIDIRDSHWRIYTTFNKATCTQCKGLYQFINFVSSQWPTKLKEDIAKVELKF
ncbi:hypothetical protein C8R44DRAFT_664927 [Mycena epipterygia]|nr:hypothetical protein C8R44DRAFT_664927 [Mycena epipterygia]